MMSVTSLSGTSRLMRTSTGLVEEAVRELRHRLRLQGSRR